MSQIGHILFAIICNSLCLCKTTQAFQLSNHVRYSQKLLSVLTDTSENEKQFKILHHIMLDQKVKDTESNRLIDLLVGAGYKSTSDIFYFAKDFESRPEMLSSILQSDFKFKPLDSHKLRAAMLTLVTLRKDEDMKFANDEQSSTVVNISLRNRQSLSKNSSILVYNQPSKDGRLNFRQFKVLSNPRLLNQTDEYGITDIPQPVLDELDAFLKFMTISSPRNQEMPIRKTTAIVYYRHARLFLGWYIIQQQCIQLNSSRYENLSLKVLFPDKSRDGATAAFQFIQFLREKRQISVNYEANVVRGLIKLAKFIFHKESNCDPSNSGSTKTFDDIPVVAELRKLHRQAAQRLVKLSRRVSDEKKKWITWIEFLDVIDELRKDYEEDLNEYYTILQSAAAKLKPINASKMNILKRRIATKLQKYLILAFFGAVPDRQRTIRELYIGKTFLKNEAGEDWIIKHGPLDYKTGNNYGDRPPLIIPSTLTPLIDDFIHNWRDCFNPKSSHLFVQVRTGNALTSNSVYEVVARSCYEKTGKKTNPHLLRDMVVTYVRDTNASEKELEALALYMGHSIQMQRSSYDRRTLNQKVAPAVNLLQSISSSSRPSSI